MNYIIDRVEDHEYYHDIFIKNLSYVFEEFEQPWENCNSKTLNYKNKNNIMKILTDEFIQFSNINDIVNSHYNKNIRDSRVWLNRYDRGEFQEPHDHTGSKRFPDLSFVYFLKISEGSHCFNFCDKDGNNKKYINETSGDLLIFDPSLHHSVDPNKSDDYRYTIAGNLYLK